ncbi:ribonuclease domain-containing protein [Nocardia sp. NPDC051570]|uniref:ribonuclease domain-containing protein n=1 Tax=Nocardia sp. NPDC051570 TaxID=3364324 RepID=UPI0037B12762
MRDPKTPKSLWAEPMAAFAAFGLALLTAMAVLLGGTGIVSTPGVAVAAQASDEIGLRDCSIPDQAWQTLQLIDAGQWPPHDGSGTKGGTTWDNREGRLPDTDANGDPMHYKEWDVNRKQPGHNRDAERIITGNLRTAWYTGDHYNSFCQMR